MWIEYLKKTPQSILLKDYLSCLCLKLLSLRCVVVVWESVELLQIEYFKINIVAKSPFLYEYDGPY